MAKFVLSLLDLVANLFALKSTFCVPVLLVVVATAVSPLGWMVAVPLGLSLVHAGFYFCM